MHTSLTLLIHDAHGIQSLRAPYYAGPSAPIFDFAEAQEEVQSIKHVEEDEDLPS